MLRITTEKKKAKTVLSVEGRLAGPFVVTLEQCWRELRTAAPQEKFYVDLCGVSFIDGAGKMLLKEMHRQGGQLVARGCLNQAIVKEIIGSGKNSARNDDGKESKGGSDHFLSGLARFAFRRQRSTGARKAGQFGVAEGFQRTLNAHARQSG